MPDPIQFHTDLYRRDAVELAATKYSRRARIVVAESGSHVVVSLEPLARDPESGTNPARTANDVDGQGLLDDFCNEVFSATARQMRSASAEARPAETDATAEPP